MVAHFGLEVVQAYMGHVQDNAEESGAPGASTCCRDGRLRLPPRQRRRRSRCKITVDRAAREATIDFTGTSAPATGATTTPPRRSASSAVLYVFRTLVDDEIPLNEGCLKPLKHGHSRSAP